MLHISRYERPQTIEEAQALLKKSRAARVIGGGVWMRLGERKLALGIDLSDLGLDRIERVDGETLKPASAPSRGNAWAVGAMVSLHALECHADFNAQTAGVFERSVRDIVGVQMRNLATVGGSLFGRFGYSDVLCALLPLDCEVVLAQEGRVPLAEFACRKGYEHDILTHLIVHDHRYRASFQCVRRSATDFSVLNVCAAEWDGSWHVAVGARPARARLVTGEALGLPDAFDDRELDACCRRLSELPMGSNMRGSERYRRHLASALGRRAIMEAAGVSERELARRRRDRRAIERAEEREAQALERAERGGEA